MLDRDAETRKDDLRTGTPFRVKTPHSTVTAERKADAGHVDVIVVGAGISGALMAEALSRAGRSVVILDRCPPVRGSTPASTARTRMRQAPARTRRSWRGRQRSSPRGSQGAPTRMSLCSPSDKLIGGTACGFSGFGRATCQARGAQALIHL